MRNLLLAIAAALVFAAPALAYTHPAQGHKPNIVRTYQRSDNSNLTHGDLTFANPKDMPPLSSLTDMERYMLAGLDKDSGVPNGRLSWIEEITFFADQFYRLKGYLPDQLTPQLIRSLPGNQRMSEALLQTYRNPLTGEWPRLKADKPSPGYAYIRALTGPDIKYYAGISDRFRKEWIEHKGLDMQKLRSGVKDAYTKDIYPVGTILYTRFYGFNGVIEDGFYYTTMDVQPNRDVSHLWDKELSSPLR